MLELSIKEKMRKFFDKKYSKDYPNCSDKKRKMDHYYTFMNGVDFMIERQNEKKWMKLLEQKYVNAVVAAK